MPNNSKPKKPAKKPVAKLSLAPFAKPLKESAFKTFVKKVLDVRLIVHKCILKAGAAPGFNPAARLDKIGADPGLTALCVNSVFAINVPVGGADSENTIVVKVFAALPKS